MDCKTRHSVAASLVLGTAQLGMTYGVANESGQPGQNRADAIVSEAWQKGIREFDTAQAYGNSEAVLGKALGKLNNRDEARITTKLDPSIDCSNTKAVIEAMDKSLNRLGANKLHAILLHNEKHLDLWDGGLGAALGECVESGRIRYLGISVYTPERALAALNMKGLDVVQVPANIVDQRFEKEGIFKLARKVKKQIYIRSVYLQGLLLLNEDVVAKKMAFALPVVKKFHQLAKDFNLVPQELAFGYARTKFPDAKIIFGADHPFHVTENIKFANTPVTEKLIAKAKTLFESMERRVVDPSLWNLKPD